MSWVLEPQQKGVAAKFEETRAIVVGHLQERLEAVADRLGDLFRSFAALARQPLGEFREPGDINECGGAFGGPALAVWIREQPVLKNPRQIQTDALCNGLKVRSDRCLRVCRLFARREKGIGCDGHGEGVFHR